VTVTLPAEIRRVFDAFQTTEYTTVDPRGQPITWPVIPYHHVEEGCIDVSTGIGYPKKARDAEREPRVALLFSDPTGSGLERPPMVLVQGTAIVDDRDIDANRARYERESVAKLPGAQAPHPPRLLRRRRFLSYLARIYVHVRPERVYVWPDGDPAAEPELLDAHMEEVRSAHAEEPEVPIAEPFRGPPVWSEPIQALGSAGHPTAVLSFVSPDGFPFALRVPVRADAAARRLRLACAAVGAPLHAGRACLAAHAQDERFTCRRNFQIRGNLVEDEEGWALFPHRQVGGFELPASRLEALRLNVVKAARFHRTARRELARRS
jgi:hypothetical protein